MNGGKMTRYDRAHDMDSWMHNRKIAERGFAHRWQSSVATTNGEDLFIDLVNQHLRPDSDVLDLGCGHGELTLALAAKCRSIVGIERTPEYLELAKELASEQKTSNVQFHRVNLAGDEDEDRPFAGIPLADGTIDLFVNRRGPILQRYLDEALRVARSGAVIVGLHPTGGIPAPTWLDQLPGAYRGAFTTLPFDEVAGWVIDPLSSAGISDYSLWWIDVPEYFDSPYQLYARLGGSEPADKIEFKQLEPQLTKIIKEHSRSHGLVLRHRRLLWQAYLPM
jgi:SAM-dependent methyltransferase